MEIPVVQANGSKAQPGGSRQEDLQKLTAIMAHRLKYLERIAMRYLDNSHDAEDAVQDALLSAYRHLGQFRGQAQLSTWLTTIVINSARMKARGRSRQPHISIDGLDRECEQYPLIDRLSDSRPDPEDLFREKELRDKVDSLSSRLSPILRETITLRVLDELNVRETANLLGVRETAVKARTSRARAHLKRMLQKDSQSRPSWKKDRSGTIKNLPVEDIGDRRRLTRRKSEVASLELS
jgi:RNA polymerase sigma-70 factor, ECF subfamily